MVGTAVTERSAGQSQRIPANDNVSVIETIISRNFSSRQASAIRKPKCAILFRRNCETRGGDRRSAANASGAEARAHGGQPFPELASARRAAIDRAVQGRAEKVAQQRLVLREDLGELGDTAVADALHELVNVAPAENLSPPHPIRAHAAH